MVKNFNTRVLLVALLCLFLGGVNSWATGTIGTAKDFNTLSGYSPNGAAWKSNFTIDWSNQYLEIEIDASVCNPSTVNPDNLFTIVASSVSDDQMVDWGAICTRYGSAVSKKNLVHVYSGGNHQNDIALYAFNYAQSDPRYGLDKTVYGINSTTRKSLTFKISKADGFQVKVGKTAEFSTVYTAAQLGNDFFNNEMNIGSEEGAGRMKGTYTRVEIKNIGGTPVPPTPTDAVITNAIPASGTIIKDLLPAGATAFPYTATGKFEVVSDIDWNTQKIVAQVDLNHITGENDFFAMTTGDGDFTKFDGTTAAPNMHMYAKPSEATFQAFFAVPGSNSNSGPIAKPSDNIYNIDLSKAHGTVINGAAVKNHAPTTTQWTNLTAATTVKVGTGENGKTYDATYNYIRLVSADYTTGSTTTSNVLNEAAENTFEDQNFVNVVLKRTLVAGAWHTLCLPFDVSDTDLATALGTTFELRTFGNVSGTTVNFASVKNIAAGQPYLIRPEAEVVNPKFEGVDIVAGEPSLNKDGEFGMKGTYGLTTLATDGTNLFLAADNSFLEPEADKAVMKGMRAYFIVPAGTPAAALRANIDGVETSIDAIDATETVADTTVYNLQGQRVGNTLQGLPRGLYIQNGKKVVVK